MINKQHPITPPPELVNQWEEQWCNIPGKRGSFVHSYIATQAAQWGSDQELEACCEWMDCRGLFYLGSNLRAARRPEPLNLKTQALQVLASAPGPDYPSVMTVLNADEHALIRQALEALPND